jgi:hypothetical protein
MATLGELRKRVSAAVEEAGAQGLDILEIIPEEVQDHFQNLGELNEVKEYIKEADARVSDLQNRVAEMENKLKEAEQAVKDMPTDHEGRLMDLNTAKQGVEFYKNLYNSSEERAQTLQTKWQALVKKQSIADHAQLRVEQLELESIEQKKIITNMVNAQSVLQNMVATMTKTHEQAMDMKKLQIRDMELAAEAGAKYLKEKEERLDREQEVILETYGDLLEESGDVVAKYNIQSIQKRNLEMMYSHTRSEVTSLLKVYGRFVQVLGEYKPFFQHIMKLTKPDSFDGYLSDYHWDALRDAGSELEALNAFHESMDDQSGDQLHAELGTLAQSAQSMRDTLVSIGHIFTRSESVSTQSSGMWTSFRFKFGGLPK